MLHLRLASAGVLIASMTILLWMDWNYSRPDIAGIWVVPAGLFFVAGTAWEFAKLVDSRWQLRPASVAGASFVIFLVTCIPMFYPLCMAKPYPVDCPIGKVGLPLIAYLCAISYFSIWMLIDFPKEKELSLIRWAASSLITAYVGIGASFWILIRTYQPKQVADPNLVSHWELLALVGIIGVTKCSDAGAFFVGRAYGSRKLCPEISPGKTIEGALGGIATAMLISWGWFSLFLPWLFGASSAPSHSLTTLLFGLILAVVGIVGDLVESVVKRIVGAKDSGKTLPGLGGIWDVTDSILPTAVAGYLGMVAHLVWSPGSP